MATAADFFDNEHFAVEFTVNGATRRTRNPMTEDEALEKALNLADRGAFDAQVIDLIDN